MRMMHSRMIQLMALAFKMVLRALSQILIALLSKVYSCGEIAHQVNGRSDCRMAAFLAVLGRSVMLQAIQALVAQENLVWRPMPFLILLLTQL